MKRSPATSGKMPSVAGGWGSRVSGGQRYRGGDSWRVERTPLFQPPVRGFVSQRNHIFPPGPYRTRRLSWPWPPKPPVLGLAGGCSPWRFLFLTRLLRARANLAKSSLSPHTGRLRPSAPPARGERNQTGARKTICQTSLFLLRTSWAGRETLSRPHVHIIPHLS